MQSAPKKTAQTIIDSGNDYLGALKGNQSGLLKGVKANFKAQETIKQMNKGHGRIEKRTISISHDLAGIPAFPGLHTIIRVISERQIYRANIIESSQKRVTMLLLLWSQSKHLLSEFADIGASKIRYIMFEM
jgi:hypothetical protein